MKPIIALFGNCQVVPIADCLSVMLPDHDIRSATLAQIKTGKADPVALTEGAEHVFCHLRSLDRVRSHLPNVNLKKIPEIMFAGFQPDSVAATADGRKLAPIGDMNSALALSAFKAGMSREQAAELFRPDVFEAVGYYQRFDKERAGLLAAGAASDVDIQQFVARWIERGPFMHAWHHPKLFVMADVARAMLQAAGLQPQTERPQDVLRDPLMDTIVWPVYPGIAERHGLKGDFVFRMRRSDGRSVFALEEMIDISFSAYEKVGEISAVTPDLSLATGARRGNNPYRGLPSHQFWDAMTADPIDPVVQPDFVLTKATKVATAGSCFAQHIARRLAASGFSYYVAETGDPAREYGLFSARYGNIYSARQLLQLFRRAFSGVSPAHAWPYRGRYLDPFRPALEGRRGFETVDDLVAERDRHLSHVREMFLGLDVFVYTLGLTESWEDAEGTAYGMAPGAVSEEPMAGYRFVNYDVDDVTADLNAFLKELSAVNPRARVILTVSPVPLKATYEPRHVLVSTTLSKSVLRVAADRCSKDHEHVSYFPSYEIITGPHAGGRYFEEDRREVAAEGVDHVMSLFLKHYGGADSAVAYDEDARIICDEDLIEA